MMVGFRAALYRSDDALIRWTRRNKVCEGTDGLRAPHFRPQCATQDALRCRKNPTRPRQANHYPAESSRVYRQRLMAAILMDRYREGLRPCSDFRWSHIRARRYRVPDSARVRDLSRADRRRYQGLAAPVRGRIMDRWARTSARDAYFRASPGDASRPTASIPRDSISARAEAIVRVPLTMERTGARSPLASRSVLCVKNCGGRLCVRDAISSSPLRSRRWACDNEIVRNEPATSTAP